MIHPAWTHDQLIDHIYNLDALLMLRGMPAGSVNCVVTSPPYFGLRDYKVKGQVGSEPGLNEYIQTLRELFREIWRVLRDDGVVWLNLGDSYANDVKWGGKTSGKHAKGLLGSTTIGRARTNTGLPSKSMMGIPWRVAFALQDDGWTLRSDIIWSKPNPMPESVTDRPTKSHEYIFLLAKSSASTFYTHRDHAGSRTKPRPDYRWLDKSNNLETSVEPLNWRKEKTGDGKKRWRRINLWQGHDYWYDIEAIKEPAVEGDPTSPRGSHGNDRLSAGARDGKNELLGNRRYDGFNSRWDSREDALVTRNKRTVWTIAPEPNSFDHFAMFPQRLIEPMILAGCPERVCSRCGAPWTRITKAGAPYRSGGKGGNKKVKAIGPMNRGGKGQWDLGAMPTTRPIQTIGWQATCRCDAVARPGIVLDPFMGSGTTALVARAKGRHYIGSELNADYVAIAKERLRQPFEQHYIEKPADDFSTLPLFQKQGA